ncbi:MULTISPECIES: pantetheine-phosphate adenylyltransferase [Shouchella]|uniref:Phosphopantetheine adenylyltransferase n=3 Tax=Bacillaceae TaxID=186817 RepID=A0A060M319_9BACI|nr:MULTISPECIES: pantetheine-phosphate adenylyltransferase [Bacillaceae]AIC94938.1 phosphopantetheine adenylyltransferase [Shouchella lehensis G1]KQL58137.1 phosphopantetheine adenylyltransferase [Alkalicoccobacillus plakortidis]MBG9784213.1 phosphopantetheine adenylyltransferase [Shouchella lehensis]
MRRAVSSGSFDPVTNGHVDLFERAANQFDELIIVVSVNNKKSPLFSLEERVALLKQATAHIPNIVVEPFTGLLVEYAKTNGASAIIRGLRSSTDYDYEENIAAMNKTIVPEVDTLFFMTKPEYSYVSSSIVKEAASYGSDVSSLVPEPVAQALKKAYTVNG